MHRQMNEGELVMKNTMIFLFALAACAAHAAATVSDVAISADTESRMVTISYTLSENAVVTADILTNGVSIGKGNLVFMAGDVNHKITSGTSRKIYWAADEAWPGHRFDESILSARVTAWADDDPPDYMVVDLRATNKQEIAFYETVEQVPFGVTNNLYKTDKLVMRRVRARGVEWMMGSPSDETGRKGYAASEAKYEYCHRVTLTNDYYLGIYEVTQKQCKWAYGSFESAFVNEEDSPMRPVDAVACNKIRGARSTVAEQWPDQGHQVTSSSILGKFRSRTGVEFDLPTSAQWEFACRAGTRTALYNGRNLSASNGENTGLNPIAWYDVNSAEGYVSNQTHVVGMKLANDWGFYDMLGNVNEYVLDAYYKDDSIYFTDTPEIEPVGAKISEGNTSTSYNSQRFYRGGNWKGVAYLCRSAYQRSLDTWYWDAGRAGIWGFRMAAPAHVPETLNPVTEVEE